MLDRRRNGELVTTVERHRRRPCPTLPLPELFDAQAARTPDAVAVVYGRRADLRASWTPGPTGWRRTSSAWASDPSGSSRSRCRRSLDGRRRLAVLKTGAAYLPLDPSYPADRIAYMLDDAAPVVTLTTRHTGADLPADDTQVDLDDPDLAAAIARLDDGGIRDGDRRRPAPTSATRRT